MLPLFLLSPLSTPMLVIMKIIRSSRLLYFSYSSPHLNWHSGLAWSTPVLAPSSLSFLLFLPQFGRCYELVRIEHNVIAGGLGLQRKAPSVQLNHKPLFFKFIFCPFACSSLRKPSLRDWEWKMLFRFCINCDLYKYLFILCKPLIG